MDSYPAWQWPPRKPADWAILGVMSRLLIVVLLSSCGRIDYHPLPVDDDAGQTTADSAQPSGDSNRMTVDAPVSSRVTAELVVQYDFAAGSGDVVADTSGVAPLLDLQLSPGVQWTANGLQFDGQDDIAVSVTPAAKIIGACAVSDEITIEAWVRPFLEIQSGPARIVAISDEPKAGNAILAHGGYEGPGTCGGQEGSAYVLRTRINNDNLIGCPALTTADGTTDLALTHVVAMRRADGSRHIYVNGALVAEDDWVGDFADWAPNYVLALGNEPTENRNWEGEIQLVAIYARALAPTEVAINFAAGP